MGYREPVEVIVAGVGCQRCDELLANVKRAFENLGLPHVPIRRAQEMDDIIELGVVLTPALVVNGTLLSSGRSISVERAQGLLRRVLSES